MPQSKRVFRPESSEYFEIEVLRSIPHPIIGLSCASRIVMINRSAEALLGLTSGEGMGLSIGDLVDSDSGSSTLFELLRPVLTGASKLETAACSLELNRTSCTILALATAAAVENAKGPVAAVLTIRDITAIDRGYRDFLRARNLDSMQQMAGALASRCTNLVMAFQGAVEGLARLPGQGDRNSRQTQSLQRMVDSTVVLTQQLMAFAKRAPADLRIVDLNAAIVSMRPLLQDSAGPDCTLRFDLAPGLGQVEIDPSHIEEIALNLIRNAKQAMPAGGTIRVRTHPREVTPQDAMQFVDVAAGPYIILEVADSGTPIRMDDEDWMLEPFLTNRPGARGLAVAYGLTKQAGGHIWFESAAREGTRFFICLPRVESGPELLPAGDDLDGQETVLVVESDRASREAVQRTLLGHGYHVLEAATAGEALRVCRQWPGEIALIVMNVYTGPMSGPELLSRLKQMRADAKLLLVSSYSAEVLRPVGAIGGNSAFLQKPFCSEALARRVKQLLAKN